ncbi:MAG: DASH family cryptochrome [Oleibacter sp.]|nr:DASH family cryptochrome [Thalassolituus sp.]
MKQILWLRNDLRLSDHAGFYQALNNGHPLAVVFIVPKNWFEKDSHEMNRLGHAKARFLRGSLIDMHRSLENQTFEFHMYCGDPVEILMDLANQTDRCRILTSAAQAPEEKRWLEQLANLQEKNPITLDIYESQTLFQQTQMASLLQQWPSTFTHFRKIVEGDATHWKVPKPLLVRRLSLHEFSLTHWSPMSWPSENSATIRLNHAGGEAAGKQWLQEYIWQHEGLRHYKATRNQLQGKTASSHLSHYLAWGCLSPRQVWHEIEKFESFHEVTEHTYWLKFELLWREYFHWSMRVHGSALFQRHGLSSEGNLSAQGLTDITPNQHENKSPHVHHEQPRHLPQQQPQQQPLLRQPTHEQQEKLQTNPRWDAWCNAQTGVPMVDAGLKELQTTGWVSNRLRQNMASYFIHQLQLDWRLGARWFEQQLADFDVGSNWGNWAYLAGVGHDARPQRQFNLNKQLGQYDANIEHIKCWLPELNEASLADIQQHQDGRQLLSNYPAPIVTVFSSEFS